jgi:hypothetical protein
MEETQTPYHIMFLSYYMYQMDSKLHSFWDGGRTICKYVKMLYLWSITSLLISTIDIIAV